MLKKRMYNVICFENDKISATDEWTELLPSRRKGASLKSDQIYIYVKRIKNTKHVTLSIGLDICKLLNFVERDRLYLSISKKNPHFVRVSKGENKGYLLSRGNEQFTTLRLSFATSPELDYLNETYSVQVDFDFLDDQSLVLNFSDLKN